MKKLGPWSEGSMLRIGDEKEERRYKHKKKKKRKPWA